MVASPMVARCARSSPHRGASRCSSRCVRALPGSYETTVQVTQSGVYQVRADEMRGGQASRGDDGGFVVVTAPELRTIGPNWPLLAQLAQATGGRELSEPGEALSRDSAWRATRWLQLWPALLVLALLLLPLDVAARRLSLFRR